MGVRKADLTTLEGLIEMPASLEMDKVEISADGCSAQKFTTVEIDELRSLRVSPMGKAMNPVALSWEISGRVDTRRLPT